MHRTTPRPPDNDQEAQTEVVRPSLTIIWPRKTHLTRYHVIIIGIRRSGLTMEYILRLLGWSSVACGYKVQCGSGSLYRKGHICAWSLVSGLKVPREVEEEEVDRTRGGKTASKSGQGRSSPTPRRLWRTGTDGYSWLHSRLWCTNDQYGLRKSEVEKGNIGEGG